MHGFRDAFCDDHVLCAILKLTLFHDGPNNYPSLVSAYILGGGGAGSYALLCGNGVCTEAQRGEGVVPHMYERVAQQLLTPSLDPH